jgi:hypothetical protein
MAEIGSKKYRPLWGFRSGLIGKGRREKKKGDTVVTRIALLL